jgi:hypothetical protein
VILGIVLVQNITMLSPWEPLMERLTGWLFGSRIAAFTVVFVVAMAIPFSVVAAASALSAGVRRERLFENFARFGYAVIPLDLAAHLAHNLFHLLAEGNSIIYNVAGLVGVYETGPTGVVSTSTIQILQFGLIGLGAAGSILTAWKITQRAGQSTGRLREALPHLTVLFAFAALNVYLFTMPMSHRM